MLQVPARFNRNSPNVTALMPPEQAGLWLLERMRQHVGFESWADRTYFRDEAIDTYEDRSPQRNGGRCFYNPRFLTNIVEGCGWGVVRGAPGQGPLIGCSFVCAPA